MSKQEQGRYYNYLVLAQVFFGIVCIPTTGKLIDVVGVTLSIAVLYFPFLYIVADLLTEVYGYAAARRAIWISITTQIAASAIFSLVAAYPASPEFQHDNAFRVVLSSAPWFVLCGTIAVFLGDVANNFVLAKLKVRTKGRYAALRFLASTAVGQGINTAFFFTFGLWGLLPFDSLLESIFVASGAKFTIELVMLPITLRVSDWLKRVEGREAFDVDADFNPFKF